MVAHSVSPEKSDRQYCAPAVCDRCGADAAYPGLHDPETGQWHDLDQLIDAYSFAFELAGPFIARWGDAEPRRPVIVGGRCERCRGGAA